MTLSTPSQFLESLERRRRDLGMTWDALAARSRVSRATLCRLLKERQTAASFETVISVAEALGVAVQFDGAALRAEPIGVETFLKRRVEHLARKLVGMVQGTMALESQALGKRELAKLVKKVSDDLLSGSKSRLWYE
jgi:transcriptional regulator with XRE-family HTH domain